MNRILGIEKYLERHTHPKCVGFRAYRTSEPSSLDKKVNCLWAYIQGDICPSNDQYGVY